MSSTVLSTSNYNNLYPKIYYEGYYYKSCSKVVVRFQKKGSNTHIKVTEHLFFGMENPIVLGKRRKVSFIIQSKLHNKLSQMSEGIQHIVQKVFVDERKVKYLNLTYTNGIISSIAARKSMWGSPIIGMGLERLGEGKEYSSLIQKVHFKVLAPTANLICFFVWLTFFNVIRQIILQDLSAAIARSIKPNKCPVFTPRNSFSFDINNTYFHKFHLYENILTLYPKPAFYERIEEFDQIIFIDLNSKYKSKGIDLELSCVHPYHEDHDKLHSPFDIPVRHIHLRFGGLLYIHLKIVKYIAKNLERIGMFDTTTTDKLIHNYNHYCI